MDGQQHDRQTHDRPGYDRQTHDSPGYDSPGYDSPGHPESTPTTLLPIGLPHIGISLTGPGHAEAVRFDRLLMVMLLAACGGETRYLTVTSPATPPDPTVTTNPEPTPPDAAFTLIDAGIDAGIEARLTGVIPEGQSHVLSLKGDLARLAAAHPDLPATAQPVDPGAGQTTPLIRSVTVGDSGGTAEMVVQLGDREITIQLTTGGDDAGRLRFVQTGPDDVSLVTRTPTDYENPVDFDANGRLDFTLVTTGPTSTHTDSFALTVSDDPDDGPTIVNPRDNYRAGPIYSRESDLIRVSVAEDDVLILDMRNLTFSGAEPIAVLVREDFSAAFDMAQYLTDSIKGRDSAAVQLSIVSDADVQRSGTGTHSIQLEFVERPDREAPTDTDRDNVYEFALDGPLEDLLGPLAFEVTVIPAAAEMV